MTNVYDYSEADELAVNLAATYKTMPTQMDDVREFLKKIVKLDVGDQILDNVAEAIVCNAIMVKAKATRAAREATRDSVTKRFP